MLYNFIMNIIIAILGYEDKEFAMTLESTIYELSPIILAEFLFCPGAKSHHHNYKHGLLEHSIELAVYLYKDFPTIGKLSCSKIGIFHDLCKVGTYHLNKDGTVDEDPDLKPHHARRSIEMLQSMRADISQLEKICIIEHMGPYTHDEDYALLTPSDLEWKKHYQNIVDAVHEADKEACRELHIKY